MKNKHGQTPQEVTRANVLQQLRFMATNESGYAELSLYNENTSSFLKEVRKHYAKINNSLAYKWGMDEKLKVGDKVKVKKGSMKCSSQRHYEIKVGTIVKDYKDGDFKVNFGGNDDLAIDGELLVKEGVELDEKTIDMREVK